MSFAVRKAIPLILNGVASASIWTVSALMIGALACRALDESALAAIALVTPIVSAIIFLADLLSYGTAIPYSFETARGARERASELYSLGLIITIVAAAVISLSLLFGADLYLSFFGASEGVTALAREYLAWYWPVPGVILIFDFFLQMVATEGDVKRCLIAIGALHLVTFVFAFAGVRLGFGLPACAVAVLAALLVAIALQLTHFKAAANTLRFKFHFAWGDLKRIVGCCFGDAVQKLCVAVLMVVLTKIVIVHLGSSYLPVLQVALLVWSFADFTDGIPCGIPPLVTVYFGENNPAGVRRVMRFALMLSGGIGLMMTLVLLAFPALPSEFLGFTDPACIAASETAVRLVAPVLIVLSLSCLFTTYFACVSRPAWAGMISLSVYLLGPVLAVLIGAAVHPYGLWFGIAAGPFVALVALAVALRVKSGRRLFPLFLDRDLEKRTSSRTLPLTDAAVVEVSELIGEKLKRNPGVALKTSLLVEEVLLAVRDRNAGKKVLAEVSLIDGDEARLILRDDGEIFDITDADAKISSLRGFVVANLMEKQLNRQNLIITGFNRNVFSFKV